MSEEILGEGEDSQEDADPAGSTILTSDEKAEEDAAAIKKAVEEDKADAKDGDGEKADQDTDKKSEDGKADKDKDGAPAEYSEFKVPDGLEVDADALKDFTPVMQELKATQEQAQAAVDIASKMVEKTLKSQADAWADRVADWTKTAEEDKEIGGKDYDKHILLARSAMRQIGGRPLVLALEETGVGNHPELIRVFYRLGLAIGEDNLDFGGQSEGGNKTIAERMFPNQGKK